MAVLLEILQHHPFVVYIVLNIVGLILAVDADLQRDFIKGPQLRFKVSRDQFRFLLIVLSLRLRDTGMVDKGK